MNSTLEKLINRYFTNSLNPWELSKLLDLLQYPGNQRVFERYAKEYYDINLGLQHVEVNQEYLELIKQIKFDKKPQKPMNKKWYKIAAIFIGLIGISYFFFLDSNYSHKTAMEENTIIITLENGVKKVISENGNQEIVDKDGRVIGKQEGAKLNYKIENNGGVTDNLTESLVYNELDVPYGKTFQLVLSDGTLVHLNAGTSIKYPVKFLKDNREVFLNGEAYFDVAKDAAHPFIVHAAEINLRVLGTKFNINNYDDSINTVLVEGAVGLYTKDQVYNEDSSVILAPGQIAIWEKSKKNIQVNEVDVSEYIAWTQGKLLFKIRPFSEILKVLERHYDVSITNNYRFLDNQRFFATFDSETIEQILVSFQNSQPFSFEIEGNNIVINEP